MPFTAQRIRTLDDLRSFINHTICDHEQLEADAYDMTELVLVRGGKACGRYFCLHGPRETQFSAIWVTDRRTVLFYDSKGERFLTCDLDQIETQELVAA